MVTNILKVGYGGNTFSTHSDNKVDISAIVRRRICTKVFGAHASRDKSQKTKRPFISSTEFPYKTSFIVRLNRYAGPRSETEQALTRERTPNERHGASSHMQGRAME